MITAMIPPGPAPVKAKLKAVLVAPAVIIPAEITVGLIDSRNSGALAFRGFFL